MKVQIEEDPDLGVWVEAGDWFKSFMNLGVIIGRLTNSKDLEPSRILVTVSKKEFVTAAIALGISIQKFIDKETSARAIQITDLSELEPGTLIRLEWALGPRDVVFQSYELRSDGRRLRHRLTCLINGARKEFDIEKVKKFYKLPKGFPEGDYLERVTDGRGPRRNAVQEFWRTQEAPALAIFGDVTHFQEQISTRIRYEALNQVADEGTLTLGEACRVDFLSNDIYAHFINIFEQVGAFPKSGSANLDKVGMCDWVLLDGNNATTKLASREDLLDKRTIAIIELGVPRSQGKAFESFTAELNHFKEIDILKILSWQPPAGVHIWGWSR